MTTTQAPRTYGHWARPQTSGLGKLSWPLTVLLLGGLAVSFLLYFIHWLVMLSGVVLVLGLVFLLARKDRHGLNVFDRLRERVGFTNARSSGTNLYRSGPLSRVPWGTHQLPGIAAKSRLHEMQDSLARPFALVEMPGTGHYTVVIGTQPDGAAMVDQDQIDGWVASWGGWLAALSDEPGLVQATVTVETAPDPGYQLEQHIQSSIDPDASAFSRSVMESIRVLFPQGAARTTAYVALTYDAARLVSAARKRELEAVGEAIANRVSILTAELEATGAGWAAPVSASELCEVVRIAFDPAAAELIDGIHAEGGTTDLQWDTVGPAAHEAGWDYYRHDSAVSMTWMMTEAPRGVVRERVLSRLLGPHEGIARKRVSLHFRPIDAGAAADIVDADVIDAMSAASGTRSSARSHARFAAAQRTAQEEAAGAALSLFGLSLTATVTNKEDLEQLPGVVETLGKTARLRLRPAYGAQDAAFAATLPIGVVATRHFTVPTSFRSPL